MVLHRRPQDAVRQLISIWIAHAAEQHRQGNTSRWLRSAAPTRLFKKCIRSSIPCARQVHGKSAAQSAMYRAARREKELHHTRTRRTLGNVVTGCAKRLPKPMSNQLFANGPSARIIDVQPPELCKSPRAMPVERAAPPRQGVLESRANELVASMLLHHQSTKKNMWAALTALEAAAGPSRKA